MNDRNLSGIIGSLHLGEVDDMTAHRGSSNEAAVCEVGEFVTVGIGSFFLLAAPVLSGGPGTVKSTVEISGDYIAVVGEGTVDHGALSPWNTGVSNKNVETAIEFFDNVVHGVLDSLCVGNLNLISLGCKINLVRMI